MSLPPSRTRSFLALLGRLVVACLLAAPAPRAGAASSGSSSAPATLAAWEAAVARAESQYGERWGVYVEDLQTGETIYEYFPQRKLIPASNRKIITTGMALTILGPDYRFLTEFGLSSPPEPGRAHYHGSLVVRASGDPAIAFPGLRHEPRDPLTLFRGWAQALKDEGIAFVYGDLIVDASAFGADQNQWPDVWSEHHQQYSYAAVPSAFAAHENQLRVKVSPASGGGKGLLDFFPSRQGIVFSNQTRTIYEGYSGVNAEFNALGELIVTGRIRSGRDGEVLMVPMLKPLDYFAALMRQAFTDAGIQILGSTMIQTERSREQPPPFIQKRLAQHDSPSLNELLEYMMLRSNNFMAEQIWRAAAARTRGVGDRNGARQVEQAWYADLGLPWIEPGWDGSGLSRRNQITPKDLALVLRRMHGTAYREFLLAAMPSSGRTGTLRNRSFSSEDERVVAKTGTLSGVSALSGFVFDKQGQPRYVFSVMGNADRETHGRLSTRINSLIRLLIRRLDAGPALTVAAQPEPALPTDAELLEQKLGDLPLEPREIEAALQPVLAVPGNLPLDVSTDEQILQDRLRVLQPTPDLKSKTNP